MVEAVQEEMKGLLLTGFEPFDGDTINPSLEVIRALTGRASVAELPVDRGKAIEIVLAAIEAHNPDVVIMLGLWTGRSHICLERVAINADDFRIPDNAGNQPKGEAIIEDGPVGYFSTLPIYSIRDRLADAHIPAIISNTAGTYLCNRVFYSVMRHIALGKAAIIAGFIHLPCLHAQVVARNIDQPSLSLDTMVRSVELAAEVSLEHWQQLYDA